MSRAVATAYILLSLFEWPAKQYGWLRRQGMAGVDAAAATTCRGPQISVSHTTPYHGYWSGDLTNHQLLSLVSLLNTQKNVSCVYLWMRSKDLAPSQRWLERHRLADAVAVRLFDEAELARGTVLEGHKALYEPHGLGEEADKARALVLHRYGGVYFDLDVLFMRDLSALPRPGGGATAAAADWAYRWSSKRACNTALLALTANGTAARALLRAVAKTGRFHPKIVFTLSLAKQYGMDVYPPAVFDPAWEAVDAHRRAAPYLATFADFFSCDMADVAAFFPESYAYHWHNMWGVPLRINSIAGRFLERHAGALGVPVAWHSQGQGQAGPGAGTCSDAPAPRGAWWAAALAWLPGH